MQRYFFVDLDDTLFQTLRKCDANHDPACLQVRAFLPDGSANSFSTLKQQWLWQWLDQGFRMVPVTARDVQAFRRVNLPFREEVVLNHGAVILTKQGEVDPFWQTKIQAELPFYHDKLLIVWQVVEAYCQRYTGFKPRLVEDFGVTWYGVIKHEDGTEATLRTLLDELIKCHPYVLDGSLYWHLNGNNLAILPKIINKESAVSYLLDNYHQLYSEVLSFGAGDSKTDAPFLALCDYAVIPKNTQLFNIMVNI
jgi:hydroxymethylpyrimidine pyrophosphatase-like HAD family hydrolase